MNIVLTMNLPYLLSHGGAIIANRLLAEGLSAKGHDVLVVVPAVVPVLGTASQMTVDDFVNDLRKKLISFQYEDGVISFQHNRVRVHAVTEPTRLRSHLEHILDCFDSDRVLVSCEDPSQNLLTAALKKKPSQVVYLVNTPTFLPFGPQSFYPSEARTELIRKVPLITAGSQFVADYIQKWSGLSSTVFYPAIYGDGPFPDLSSFDRGYITMINPSRVKGISIFTALARENPDVMFAAVPSWGTTAEDEKVLKDYKNIHLLPSSPRFEDILSKSRIFLVPSLWQESFGLAVVQAMLHGIPVLASDVGGLGEAKLGTDFLFKVNPIEKFEEVMDGNRMPTAFVPEQDITPWNTVLRQLISDVDFYRQHSQKARTAALNFVKSLNYDAFEKFLLGQSSKIESKEVFQGPQIDGVRERYPQNIEQRLGKMFQDLTPEQRTLVMLRLKNKQKALPEKKSEIQEVDTGKWNPLLPIQPNGSRTPVFMVHAFTGRAEFYGNLAKYLDQDQPLFALHAPDIYDINAPEMEYPDMEAAAKDYVDTVKKVQKTGPYFIGGYSFGSGLAFAMALELRRQGCEVAFLGILDSDPFQNTSTELDDSAVVILRVRDLEQSSGRFQNPISFDDLDKYQGEDRLDYVFRRVKESMALPQGMDLAGTKRMIQRYRQREGYARRFKPRVFDGEVTLFLTEREAELNKLMKDDWSRFSTRPLITEGIPGNHDNLVREPHIKGVGEAFGRQLKKAQLNCEQDMARRSRETTTEMPIYK